ncbi:MAG: LPS export ABC transporter periplasmic protein LptC [Rhizobiaceae bacterium]
MNPSPSDHRTNRATAAASGPADPAQAGAAFERAYLRAQRHSRRVRVLKIALPALALLVVAGVGLYSLVGLPGGVSVNLGGTVLEGGRLVMANPELDGYTPENRPYSMRAERATQAVGNTNVIHLEKIGARLPIDRENWAEVDAEAGVFDREANTLELSDGVTISMDTGMTASLRSAMVDIGLGVMSTAEPVEINMSGTRLSADSMRVAERGGVLIFENRVRMVVDMQRLEQAQTSEETVNAQ